MFENSYKENIKNVMNWNEIQFLKFNKYFQNMHTTYISDLRQSNIYSNDYWDLLFSLYFVLCQTDVTNKIKDRKSILLTLMLFYSVEDTKLIYQSSEALEILDEFLNKMVELNLISITTKKKTNIFLSSFTNSPLIASDIILQSDLQIINDLINSTDPIILKEGHAMFYYEDPYKTVFKVKKPYPAYDLFYDKMFYKSKSIQNKLLKDLYLQRLYKFMNSQAKKPLFPF